MTAISRRLKISFMLCTFGPRHGKFLYDGAGNDWENFYSKSCILALESNANNLDSVARYMNEHFSRCVSTKSTIHRRRTLVIPPQLHSLSLWDSIPQTTKNFCYFVSPTNSDGVYVRRYWCSGCSACANLNFLQCSNTQYGNWSFHKFILKKKDGKKRANRSASNRALEHASHIVHNKNSRQKLSEKGRSSKKQGIEKLKNVLRGDTTVEQCQIQNRKRNKSRNNKLQVLSKRKRQKCANR